jgi:quinol monooxygenase YgiN
MLIVQGVFQVDPAERDAFLAQNVEAMKISRAEKGCLEYVYAADPVEADRVVLSERWESLDDLNAHLAAAGQRRQAAAGSGEAPGATPVVREIVRYDVSSSQSLI